MEEERKVFGVDVLLEDEEESPFCEHGPTILFEKFVKDKPSLKYYACAACRDRKECNFYQIKDAKITEGKRLLQKEIKKQLVKKATVEKCVTTDELWCLDCGDVIQNNKMKHKDHQTKTLSREDVLQPTYLLQPKSNRKSNAQYFFTEDTCSLFTTLIKKMQFKKVICIGTPRLFEKILPIEDISTILLDIDDRFRYFYKENMFIQYNMFNNFFFEMEKGENKLKKFLKGSKPEEILVVVDPPFGGLATLLAHTLKKVWGQCNMRDDVPVATILVFPYFLESHINSSLPTFKMMDFKVSYSNHNIFNNSAKKGSPVRLFTNISADKISLPKEDYRFCKLCQRYVYKENRHCEKCEACTSKDGRTYVHCERCEKCVKPGLVHCETCNSCHQVEHQCNLTKEGCHICGDMSHKRKDCPKKIELEKKSNHGKRKFSNGIGNGKSLAKKKKKPKQHIRK